MNPFLPKVEKPCDIASDEDMCEGVRLPRVRPRNDDTGLWGTFVFVLEKFDRRLADQHEVGSLGKESSTV